MMPPNIQPIHELPFTGAGAEAEKKTLNFLKALPDHYFVLRELRMHPSQEKRRAHSQEDRPDLVVIGPDIGVVVLEVKDWNLKRNTYEWLDQYTVRKTNELAQVADMRNPYAQVNEYIHAVHELLKFQLGQQSVYVHGFVVYPRLTRAEFENAFTRGQSGRPNVQERFLLDIQRTVFSDMLDRYWDSPLELLRQLVKLQVKQPYAEVEIAKTVNALIPPKLRVGDISKQDRGYEHLLLMDEEQQKWAFSEEISGKNYMLDVAGSGKTNILLSRAMHLSDMHSGMPDYRVLVLTYSEALARDLVRLLANKIKDGSFPDAHQYKQTIVIMHIAELMESLLVQELGTVGMEAWRMQVKSQLTNKDEYLEIKLPERCQDMLYAQSKRFQIFDYLLVDEVQDFSDFFLDVALCLLKRRENVFMVGDVGQKLFDRKHNLSELGMIEERVRVRGNYRMYRSPRLIARIAWAFLRQDRFIAHELREQEYEAVSYTHLTLPTILRV